MRYIPCIMAAIFVSVFFLFSLVKAENYPIYNNPWNNPQDRAAYDQQYQERVEQYHRNQEWEMRGMQQEMEAERYRRQLDEYRRSQRELDDNFRQWEIDRQRQTDETYHLLDRLGK